ncbi:MAG: hypothetical protein IJ224_08895 [Lachnospiraceae bacterium]|nr:hypothetical protein [Lachnospiraceae bacterium]
MNNKGQITVFISLIMCALVLLGLFAVKICEFYNIKSKTAQIINSAISDVKSEFNSYIFEHYHILLFDKTDYGKGEAAVEEFLSENINNNLDDNQKLDYMAIIDFDLLMDNDCEAFKTQINDYTAYAAIDYGAETILSKTGGMEAVIDDSVFTNMDTDTDSGSSKSQSDISSSDKNEINIEKTNNNIESESDDDPRVFTKTLGKKGILLFVVPDDMDVSTETVNLSECPTKGRIGLGSIYNTNDKFDSYSRLKKDLKQNSSWNNALIDAGCGLAYARNVFNCAVNQEVNTDSVFKFEMEYLICGRASDYMNLKYTVNKIIAIRFPVNYSYLLTDTPKMNKVKAIAYSLSLTTAIPEPILKYLIAGCWSYAEAVSDVRQLLRGHKIAFKKDNSNWKTDIYNLAKSFMEDEEDKGEGMSYEDYLLILMAMNMDNVYPRMLDVIQLNTRQFYPDFKMENAAVGLTVDTSIECEDSIFGFCISGGY